MNMARSSRRRVLEIFGDIPLEFADTRLASSRQSYIDTAVGSINQLVRSIWVLISSQDSLERSTDPDTDSSQKKNPSWFANLR
jgi:hypothetical protein